MNKYPFILLIVICCQAITWAQPKELLVHYYFATDDYLQNNLSVDEILLEVKSMGEDFILVKGIYDPATRKRPDLGWKVWAIDYEDKAYMHLVYSYESKVAGLFIQIDLKGRFCLAIMDLEADGGMKTVPGYYGGGLINAASMAIAESATQGIGKFQNKEGKYKKIFFIDTKDLSFVIPYKSKNAPAELLTKSTLKWLVGKENFKGSTADYTVEEIIAIVEDLNRRQ